MIKNLFSISLLMLLALSFAQADSGELDQDRANQSIQGTVILRQDQRTGETVMAEVSNVLMTADEAKALINTNFKAIPEGKIKTELDREAGASSWYWYYPYPSYGYSYSSYYYYYGHCYSPWYSYSYGYYNYYYYNRYSYSF